MSDEHPMHRIIRLKRYEQPPEGYFDDFLREFHRRQRADLLNPSLGTLILERIQAVLSEIRVPAMAYAGAAAVAVVASVVILRQPGVSVAQPAFREVSYTQRPITIENLQPVSFKVEPRFDSLYSVPTPPPAAGNDSPRSF